MRVEKATLALGAALCLSWAWAAAAPIKEEESSTEALEWLIEPSRLRDLQAVYPGAHFKREEIRLDDGQRKLLTEMSGATVLSPSVTLYRAERRGRLDGVVTFFTAPDQSGAYAKVAVGTSPDGRIEKVLSFAPAADPMSDASFLRQFDGRRAHREADWRPSSLSRPASGANQLRNFATAVRASSALAVVAAGLGVCLTEADRGKGHAQSAKCGGCGRRAEARPAKAGELACCSHCAMGRACGCR